MKKQDNNKVVRIVGADVGFGTAVGVVIEFDPITKRVQVVGKKTLASRAKQGRNLKEDLFQPLKNGYSVNGMEFTVDPDLEGEGVVNRANYHFSPIQCVLMQHLLQNLQLENSDNLHVVSGLPISLYYSNHQSNDAMIEKKIETLRNTSVTPLYPAQPISLQNISILPEGVGAYLNHILTDDGQIIAGEDGKTVAVLDIGDGTSDIVVLSNLTVIDHARTASKDLGVSNMTSAVRAILEKDYGIKNESEYRIKKMLYERVYRARGQDFSRDEIIKILTTAMASVYHQLNEFIGTVLSKDVDIDDILIVGGGAELFGPEIAAQYPTQAKLMAEPQLANALGFAKFGLYNYKRLNA